MSNERRYKVLTAVGRDRPGLVQRIAAAIHEAGANLEDSRMAILGGEFALILLFSGTSDAVGGTIERARGLETELKLRITFDDTSKGAPSAYLPYRLRVTGIDRPGIVANVTRVLAGRAINVASLESRVQYAPLSGTPLFVLSAELQVPSEVVLSTLRRELLAVCDDENLDFTLEGG
jgi:glycine cleavage system transcriptional repressor